jgi:hypothetical protein
MNSNGIALLLFCILKQLQEHFIFYFFLINDCQLGVILDFDMRSSFLGAKHSMMGNGKGILKSISPKKDVFHHLYIISHDKT